MVDVKRIMTEGRLHKGYDIPHRQGFQHTVGVRRCHREGSVSVWAAGFYGGNFLGVDGPHGDRGRTKSRCASP